MAEVVLAVDPSGNWLEGRGTTGFVVLEDGEVADFGALDAKKYRSQMDYWHAHVELLEQYRPTVLAMEDYRLYQHKSLEQSGSTMETPQLIGILKYEAWKRMLKIWTNPASNKQRFNDEILVRMGILEKKGRRFYLQGRLVNEHTRDALRHGLYYWRYGRKKV